MMLAIPALATDLPPVALRAGVGQAIASALQTNEGVPADLLPIAFSDVAMEDVADAEIGEGDIASLDAWVAQALAQALDAESPADVLPAMQAGTPMPSHLAQALEARGEVPVQALPLVGQVDARHNVAQPVPQGFGMQLQAEPVEMSKAQALSPLGSTPATPVRDTGATAPTQAAMSVPSVTSAAGETQPMPSTGVAVPEGFSRLGALMAEPAADTAQAPARNAEPTQAQQKLLDALGERLSVQTQQGMRHAVIRLDPYMSGSVRIELRQEANGLAVHLSATNADVVRQLQAIGESLRQDLGARNGGDVTVQVSAARSGHTEQDASGQHRERQARDDAQEHVPGRGLTSAGGDGAFELTSREAARMQKEPT